MARFSFKPSVSVGSLPAELPKLESLAERADLSPQSVEHLLAAYVPLSGMVQRRWQRHGGPIVVGISGSQGSGKTTLARLLGILLQRLHGLRVVGLSLDDLYYGPPRRRRLARDVHPLLVTRGAPGTHDVALGIELLDRLRQAGEDSEITIPSFDKSRDDLAPRRHWPVHRGPVDVILFEGWCVAALPQSDEQLRRPVNQLERRHDTGGSWRRYVNSRLSTDYAELFAGIDCLIFLAVPSFAMAKRWRSLQERRLARRRPNSEAVMDPRALDRFMMLYERITLHALDTLPEIADVVCRLDEQHRVIEMLSGDPLMDVSNPEQSSST